MLLSQAASIARTERALRGADDFAAHAQGRGHRDMRAAARVVAKLTAALGRHACARCLESWRQARLEAMVWAHLGSTSAWAPSRVGPTEQAAWTAARQWAQEDTDTKAAVRRRQARQLWRAVGKAAVLPR